MISCRRLNYYIRVHDWIALPISICLSYSDDEVTPSSQQRLIANKHTIVYVYQDFVMGALYADD